MKLISNSYVENLRYRLENRAFLARMRRDRRGVSEAFKQDSVDIPFYSSLDVDLPRFDISVPIQWVQRHFLKLSLLFVIALSGYLAISYTPDIVDLINTPESVQSTTPPIAIDPFNKSARTVDITPKPSVPITKTVDAVPAVPLPKYAVLVIKSTKALHIVKQTNQKWDIVQSLSIATGEFEGDKMVEGDKKTPEGNYFIKDIKTGESQGSLYGALVFKLNYPNDDDIKAQKTGGGIWIHGVEFGLSPVYTKGCVALSNKDVVKLIPYLKIGTPVTILPEPPKNKLEDIFSIARLSKEYPKFHSEYVIEAPPKSQIQSIFSTAQNFAQREAKYLDNEKIESTSQETYDYFRKFVSGWKTAWESRNPERYSSFYHPNFVDNRNRDKEEFIKRKGYIFNSKDSINVKIEKIQVFHKADSLIQVSFIQDYTAYTKNTPQKFGKRTKFLYLKKHNDNWLINTEK